mmetsp:Transcript_31826/g.38491  ORF Transcript_31826/g.38491 Transcript_31826/m.38491 type:complete len:234 (+) Transcript_31826:262-963(+)
MMKKEVEFDSGLEHFVHNVLLDLDLGDVPALHLSLLQLFCDLLHKPLTAPASWDSELWKGAAKDAASGCVYRSQVGIWSALVLLQTPVNRSHRHFLFLQCHRDPRAWSGQATAPQEQQAGQAMIAHVVLPQGELGPRVNVGWVRGAGEDERNVVSIHVMLGFCVRWIWDGFGVENEFCLYVDFETHLLHPLQLLDLCDIASLYFTSLELFSDLFHQLLTAAPPGEHSVRLSVH